MPYEFKFPDVGEGIHEGTIQKWFVKEGDKVKADQPLGEIETDKAVVEMPNPKTGTIYKIHVKEGGTIKVGEIMLTILLEGEDEKDIEQLKQETKEKEEQENAQTEFGTTKRGFGTNKIGTEKIPYTGSVVGFLEEAKDVLPIKQPKQQSEKAIKKETLKIEIKATPAVRNLAKQLNIDLSAVKGTGPEGAVTIKDVQSASPHKQEGQPQIKIERKYDLYGYVERQKLHGVRKVVAQKMAESLYTAPQVTNMNEADATELFSLRESEKAQYEKEGIKLTFMPYIIKAVQLALVNNPNLNASVENDEIVIKKYYNIGIATDTEDGLMVPVIKRVEQKSIKEIASEMESLVEQARARKINLMDLKGGTFTITNLGTLGVEFFTPILNYPEVAIFGIGKIAEKPAVKNGKVEARKILPLSLTYDHRAVDGAQAARFMNELIKLLENPKGIK